MILAFVFAVWMGSGLGITADSCQESIIPEKTLLINDPKILESGHWDFGSLMTLLAASHDPVQFTEHWLSQWETITSWNGKPVEPRQTHLLKQNWRTKELDPSGAPFRLLAIVFRPDLRGQSAGEGRFVFGAYNKKNGAPLDFTLILEFKLPGSITAWAKKLESLNRSSAQEYLSELLRLTKDFARREHFLQLRTNDFLLKFEWELREFGLDTKGELSLRNTAQTPSFDFSNESPDLLIQWIKENESEVESGTAVVPNHLLGGVAPVPTDRFKWLEQSGLSEGVRRSFSSQTCNGCHGGETRTIFLHVVPRYAGYPAWLSPFLKNDLILRKRDLENLICSVQNGAVIPQSVTLGRVH